jgi:hypothetical protein
VLRFIENDPEALAAYVRSVERGLIIFDGRPTAGKTYLARSTSKQIQCNWVDTDEFLIKNQKQFLGALRLDALRNHVEASLAATPLVLLSGVCGRQVIERAQLTAAAFVWVEKSSLACLKIDRRDFVADYNRDLPYADPLLAEALHSNPAPHTIAGVCTNNRNLEGGLGQSRSGTNGENLPFARTWLTPLGPGRPPIQSRSSVRM